jgi:hypothetical protein
MTGRPPALQGVALPRPPRPCSRSTRASAMRTSTLYSVAHYLPGGAIDRAIVDAHRSAAGETRLAADHEVRDPSAALTSLDFLRRAAAILGFRGASFQPDVSSYRPSARPASCTTPSAASRSGSPAATAPPSTTTPSATARSACSRSSTISRPARSSCSPTNSLHGLPDAWISACVQAMGARQAFITGQDPRVLAHLGLDSLARVQARIITCEVVRDADGAEQLQWRTIATPAPPSSSSATSAR